MTVPALVTVRTASTRLPMKCLLDFGEGNVLEHVIRRAQYSGFYPVVCTTTLSEDDLIKDIATRESCPIYRGSVGDKLQRWLEACAVYDISAFHTIDADDPFFDGELGYRSFQMLEEGYDIIYPALNTYVGAVGFSLTREIVERACSLKKSNDTEMMWYYIERVTGVREVELLVPDARLADIRLTLDYEEDYWLLCTVLRILGPQATRIEVEDLFLRNPDLRLVNWFRNEQWKKIQEDKGAEASD